MSKDSLESILCDFKLNARLISEQAPGSGWLRSLFFSRYREGVENEEMIQVEHGGWAKDMRDQTPRGK